MARQRPYFSILLSVLLLSGCSGISIDYLRARASYLLSNPADQPVVIWSTATPAPTKLVILRDENSIPTVINEDPAQATIEQSLFITGKVTAGAGNATVYVRGGPGTLNDRIGTLSDGQIVEVTGRTPAGDWWRIKEGRLEGWIFTAYLTVDHPQSVPCIEMNEGDCSPPAVPAVHEQAINTIRSLVNQPDRTIPQSRPPSIH